MGAMMPLTDTSYDGSRDTAYMYSPQGADIENPSLKGLIPRITEQIFASILSADSSIEYTVKVSYMEIYMERIKDLLARESSSGNAETSTQRQPLHPRGQGPRRLRKGLD